MGKFLNKLKKLFSTSDETETLHSSDVPTSLLPPQPSAPTQDYATEPQPVTSMPTSTDPQPVTPVAAQPVPQPATPVVTEPVPQPAAPVVTEPVPQPVTPSLNIASLLSVAEQISQLTLFQPIGAQLVALLSTPTPTKEAILSIITQAQPIIDAQMPLLSNLTPASQYQNLIKEMLNLAPLDTQVDHDHLVESNVVATMQSLTKYYNVLEKLLTTSNFSSEVQTTFNNLTQPLTQASTSFNDLITQFKTFKSQEATLRQEIEGYAQAVEQMQKQNSMSPDWGGKKSAFEQKGAELTQRRTTYMQDETKINQAITAICSQITSIQHSFKEFLTLVSNEFSNTPDQSHLLAIKNQIDAFQILVKQLSGLIV